jgi:predicted NAD/FAD-dependent oxidoreductase
MRRRDVLVAAAGLPFAGCAPPKNPNYTGDWVGAAHARGHRLRHLKSGNLPTPAVQRRASVLVIGAGIAGLSCARGLLRAGISDVHVLDLEDSAGGNSRGHRMGGMACPLGAHYLPVPNSDAVDVIALLEELGLRRTVQGKAVYDERHLCHSPQERLFIDGHWVEGLLPPIDALAAAEREATSAQYRRFGQAVAQAARSSQGGAFRMPTAQSVWSPELSALDAITFSAWLDTNGYTAPALRWYLDYCCRDDYGAGAAQVSAWAGLHYFASRHGFHAPDHLAQKDDASSERDGVLTWPEGNGWLSQRMAAPLAGHIHTGQIALRVEEARAHSTVDAWNEAAQGVERWTAGHVVMAVPLFIAARLLTSPPTALQQAAAAINYSPWLVANLHVDAPLEDHAGAPPSWDNVIYDPQRGSAALGYVDAMHQSTRPHVGPTVLTAYWALGGDSVAQLRAQRARLMNEPWSVWAEAVISDLARAHPDLKSKVRQVDLMRYGHAMAVPSPGVRSSAALLALAAAPSAQTRVHFAHADLSGYSVFEEALGQGSGAARRVLSLLG